MERKSLSRKLILLILVLASAFSGLAQNDSDKKSKSKPILWEAVDVRRQNLFYGPGGEAGQPDARRFTFIREDKGGHSKKYRVKDASGNVWVAKIGDEAQSETAAVRLLSAIGYQTEINYLLPRMTIQGKGTFSNVRLEARPDDIDRGKEWKWGGTPFEKTSQMQGLMLMMAFFNNWDMKSANNVVLRDGTYDRYAISDLGVSFGKTGSNSLPLFWRIGRSRNKPSDYANSQFITKVSKNRVKVHFNGKNRSRMDSFTTLDARWLADLLGRLSDRQIRDAFRAANYRRGEIDLLTQEVRSRIRQLDRAGIDRRVSMTR